MPGALKYKDGAGYSVLYGGSEEVTISANQPPVNTDLWVNPSDGLLRYFDPASLTYKGAGPNVGARNVIRNGDMSIAQRGNGSWSWPGYGYGYIVDGFYVENESGGGSLTMSRVAQAPGSGSWLMRAATAGHAAAADGSFVLMPIEGVETLNGRTVTLSFDAFAASGTPKLGLEAWQQFGSGGSGVVYTAIGAVTLGATKARYTVTFTIPSITGKTVGTGSNYLAICIWLSAGTNYAARASSIGVQNNTFSFTDIQLEAGTVATPFERLPIQQQLAWCQRYFYRRNSLDHPYSQYGTGRYETPTDLMTPLTLPVEMRTPPTFTCSAASYFGLTALAMDVPARQAIRLKGTTSGATVGQAGLLQSNNAGAYIDLSAEL